MNKATWLYKDYELYFPHYAHVTEDWYQDNEWDLVAKLNDGSRIIYDSVQRSVRSLPTSKCITEDQLRIEFSKRLFKMLYRRGITQKELSKRTGISHVVINRYITKKVLPSLHNAYLIARSLGCSIDDLLLVYKKDWD